ncbi:MAG: TssQ family T6SS-associated lipoprotein [Burkholderiales bacterium]|nr:TssQ family T6SS-associated lipoprotein [Burkholderiales bacterium]
MTCCAGPRRLAHPVLRSVPAPAARALGPAALAALAILGALGGCASPASPPPAASPAGLADLIARPAEGALFDGMRAYDDGQYASAEGHLRRALAAGLRNPHDLATAHKLLAFITCASDRLAECEQQFRAAREADPAFVLSRSEAGHPLWGPVYRRVVAQ